MKENKKLPTICILRTTSIINDSRILKESGSLAKKYNLKILGWDRQKIVNKKSIVCNGENISLHLFLLKCNYGGGIKSLFKIALFEIWLFFQLVITRNSYDIIHSCDLDTGIIGRVVSKIFHKKFVYDIYDYYIDSHTFPQKILYFLEKQEIKTINVADLVLLCTEQRKKQIEKANPKNVIIIHNTPNLSKKTAHIKLIKENSALNIAYFGILQGDRLLKEVGEAIKNMSNVNLHIGGFGAYENYFKELSIQYDNIYFHGTLPYEDVLELENQADVLFATYNPEIKNHRYSAPNKFYEAMALGKPIIVCKNTGVDELVIEHNLGIAIDYSAISFLEGLKKLDNINFSSKQSKNLYKKEYSWNIMENRLLNGYEKIFEEEES